MVCVLAANQSEISPLAGNMPHFNGLKIVSRGKTQKGQNLISQCHHLGLSASIYPVRNPVLTKGLTG